MLPAAAHRSHGMAEVQNVTTEMRQLTLRYSCLIRRKQREHTKTLEKNSAHFSEL
jgi:hypothetical protein